MITNKKRFEFFKKSLLWIIILFKFTDFHRADAISCVLNSRQTGECTPLKDCQSAIFALRQGIDPEYCNFEGGSVCCIDYVRENQGALEDKDYSVEPSNHPPRQQYHLSHSKNPYIIEQDSDEIGINYERKKHSISDSSYSEADRIGSNPIDGSNEELDRFGRIPNNLYKGVGNFNRPVKRGDLLKYNGRRQDSQFVPPGLAKKKPWKEEKITDYDFYNEYDPTKLQGPNGPHHRGPDNYNSNDHYLETDRPSQWEDNKPQWSSEGERPNGRPEWPNQGKRTSKRPPWSNQGKRTNAPPGWHGQNPNSHNNHWTTTKHNKWPQETTTVRNEYSGSNGKPHGNKHTTRRPPKTTTEPDQHNIWPSEQSSRPQENQSIVTPDSPGKLRISELKCQEYSKTITKNITGLPLTTNPDPVIITVRKCIQAQQLIVGGENTTVGEFPHMAAIGFRDRNKQEIAWNCGGTLISDQFVLTAAHCTSTSSGSPVKVRLGEFNLMKNDDGAYPVDYAISKIITHPEYKPPSKYNDIALLKLSRKVTFYKHIRPACLYLDERLSQDKAVATGWGRRTYDGNVSEVLQKVVLSIVDNNLCNNLYKTNVKTEVLSRGIVGSQLCAGELSGGKDTCQGDSGGPLSITNTKCIHHIIGITSFGKSCALPNSTGVYTRVSAYVPWIESIVWPEN